MVAREFGTRPRHRVLSKVMIKAAGWFDKTIAEMYEMLYQYYSDYLFDSTKFAEAFNFEPTSYENGIRITTEGYKRKPIERAA